MGWIKSSKHEGEEESTWGELKAASMMAVKKSRLGGIKSSKHDGEEESTWGELKAASM
jgi:hypothetical protein